MDAPGRLGMAGVIVFLLLAGNASGALSARQDTAVNPSATIPLTLVAGSAGSTTLGASATSASTTLTGLTQLNAQILKIHRGSGSWDVSIRLDTATGTGLAPTNSATIRAVLGVVNNIQGVATEVTPTTLSIASTPGSVVTISGATDIAIQVTSAHAVLGTITLGMTILIVPNGATNPSMSYSYSLLLN